MSIEATSDWTIENSSDWYGAAPLSGAAGRNEITVFTQSENPSSKERVHPFILKQAGQDTEYFVIQAVTKGIDIPTGGKACGIDGGELSVTLGGNVEYTVESRTDWITVQPGVEYGVPELLEDQATYSEYVSSSFTLTLEKNGGELRTGEVVLLTDGQEYPLEIHQMGEMPVDYSRDFFRRSAIMKFTGTWCGNCPTMTEDLKKVMEANPDRIVLLNVYDVNSTGGLAFEKAEALESKYGISGYPTGVVNDIAKHVNNSAIDAQRLFSELVNEAITSYPARTSIGGFSNVSEGNIAVNLKIAAKKSDNYRICIFLLENGIQHRQEGVRGDYLHNYVLRSELTELAGEELVIEGNTTGSFNMEVPMPDCVQDINNAYIVAFVTYAGTPGTQEVKYAQYLNCGTIIDNVVEMPLDGFVFFEYE